MTWKDAYRIDWPDVLFAWLLCLVMAIITALSMFGLWKFLEWWSKKL